MSLRHRLAAAFLLVLLLARCAERPMPVASGPAVPDGAAPVSLLALATEDASAPEIPAAEAGRDVPPVPRGAARPAVPASTGGGREATGEDGTEGGSWMFGLGGWFHFALPHIGKTAVAASALGVPLILLPPLMRRARESGLRIPGGWRLRNGTENRRRSLRVMAEQPVLAKLGPVGATPADALVQDVSMGGAALCWAGPELPAGTHVRIRIDGFAPLEGVVVAQTGSLVRLQFASLDRTREREVFRLRLHLLTDAASALGFRRPSRD